VSISYRAVEAADLVVMVEEGKVVKAGENVMLQCHWQ